MQHRIGTTQCNFCVYSLSMRRKHAWRAVFEMACRRWFKKRCIPFAFRNVTANGASVVLARVGLPLESGYGCRMYVVSVFWCRVFRKPMFLHRVHAIRRYAACPKNDLGLILAPYIATSWWQIRKVARFCSAPYIVALSVDGFFLRSYCVVAATDCLQRMPRNRDPLALLRQ